MLLQTEKMRSTLDFLSPKLGPPGTLLLKSHVFFLSFSLLLYIADSSGGGSQGSQNRALELQFHFVPE